MTTSVLLTAHGKLDRLAKRLKCEVTTIASRHYFEPRQAGRQAAAKTVQKTADN